MSASDFGFHNAINSEDGRLYFVDFEYFGWDDPAKMISDFFLQPALRLPVGLREGFFNRIRGNYKNDPGLEMRLSMIYPILGVKWCLIMLNVFLGTGYEYAGDAARSEYLGRSKEKLIEVRAEVDAGTFPIGLENGA